MEKLLDYLNNNQLLAGMIGGSSFYFILNNIKNICNYIQDFFVFLFGSRLTISNQHDIYYYALLFLKRKIRRSNKNVKIYNLGKRIIEIPSNGNHWFFYRYGFIKAAISEKELQNSKEEKESISFFVFGLFSQWCVAELIKNLMDLEKKESTFLNVYRYAGWWEKGCALPQRSFESIYLEGDTSETIDEKIDQFFQKESFYKKHGIKYKLGILLHGKPGTGKTSTIIALANKYRKNICYLDLGTLEKASDVPDAFHRIPNDSFLVIEDIDCFKQATDRQTDDVFSMSTLLSAMDGIYLPEGTVIFGTTNHPEKLDDALVRSGRFDYKFEFDYASEQTAKKMIGDTSGLSFPIRQSDLQKILLERA